MTHLLNPNLNQFGANTPTVLIALKLIGTWAQNDLGVICKFSFNFEANLGELTHFKQMSLSIPPEIVRKPEVFWRFQGV